MPQSKAQRFGRNWPGVQPGQSKLRTGDLAEGWVCSEARRVIHRDQVGQRVASSAQGTNRLCSGQHGNLGPQKALLGSEARINQGLISPT